MPIHLRPAVQVEIELKLTQPQIVQKHKRQKKILKLSLQTGLNCNLDTGRDSTDYLLPSTGRTGSPLFDIRKKNSSIFRRSGPHVASLGLTSPCAVRTRTSLRSQPNPRPLQDQPLRDQPPNDRLHNDQQLSNQQHKQPQHHNKIIAVLIQTTALSAAQRPGISKQILAICNSESKTIPDKEIGLGLWCLAPKTPSATDFR